MPKQFHKVYVFLDNNIFLHCRPIQDLDWLDELSAKEVVLLVAPITSSELDKYKNSDSRRKSTRAIAAINFLDSLPDTDRPQKIKPHVYVQYLTKGYSDYSSYQLDPFNPDDKLLLSAIHFSLELGTTDIRIVTRDKGLRVRSKSFGLTPIKTPVHWELPPETDPIEKENRSLKRKLGASPSLSLGGTTTFQLTDNKALVLDDPKDLARLASEFVFKHPKISNDNGLMLVAPALARAHNQKLSQYYTQIEYWIAAQLKYELDCALTIPLELNILNDGDGPANDLRLILAFPDSLLVTDKQVTEPVQPEPPKLPKMDSFATGRLGSMFPTNNISMFEPPQLDLLYSENIVPHNKWSPHLSIKSTNTVEINLANLQHKSSVVLPLMFATFKEFSLVEPFIIQGKFLCNEFTDWHDCELQIKAYKSTTDGTVLGSNSKQLIAPQTIN